MAMMATSIPVASVKTSKLVVDSDLDLTGYTLKAGAVRADTLDELTVSGGIIIGLGSGGSVSIQNDAKVTGSLDVDTITGDALAGYLKKAYTGNSGTEVFASIFPGITYAEVTGTTYATSGIKLRIPDTGVPGADLKFRFKLKSSGNYAGTLRVYKNGVYTNVYAETTGTHTTLQWCNAYGNVAVAAGDYLEFYLANNNANTETQLFEIQILGDVTTAGVINDESDTPAGLS